MEIKKGMILKAVNIPNKVWTTLYYDPECPFYLVDRIIEGTEDYVVVLIPLSKKISNSYTKNRIAAPAYLKSIKRCFEISSFEEAATYIL